MKFMYLYRKCAQISVAQNTCNLFTENRGLLFFGSVTSFSSTRLLSMSGRKGKSMWWISFKQFKHNCLPHYLHWSVTSINVDSMPRKRTSGDSEIWIVKTMALFYGCVPIFTAYWKSILYFMCAIIFSDSSEYWNAAHFVLSFPYCRWFEIKNNAKKIMWKS